MQEKKESISYLPESERGQYLSLKEAAELTTYSPDYIGQLIRAGKIEGHQVYTTVSWVTTEKAIRAYMESRGKGLHEDVALSEDMRVQRYVQYVLYGVIVCLGCILLILCYIFFVGIDHAVTDSYIEDFDMRGYVQ